MLSMASWRLYLIYTLISACLVNATNILQRPLKRIEQPSVVSLEILPRTAPRSLPLSVPPDSPELQYSDSFRLTLSAYETLFYLHLRPNPHVVHPAAHINYYITGPDGRAILNRTEPLLRESVKVYWGDVVHADNSHGRLREDAAGGLLRPSAALGWARIMVHSQGSENEDPVIEGAFSYNGDIHHIHTSDNYFRNKNPMDPQHDEQSSLVIFRDSDRHAGSALDSDAHSYCAHDHLEWNTDPSLNPAIKAPPPPPTWYERLGFLEDPSPSFLNVSLLPKRDDIGGGNGQNTNFADKIGQSAGCSTTQQVLYMGVAADCKYVQNYGSEQNATQQILKDWNMVSGLYKSTFNTSLAIVQLDMHSPTCPTPGSDPSRPWNVDCTSNVTLNDRLSTFSQWRGQKGADGAGLWHLMSGCPTGTEVGVAWLGTLCQVTASGSGDNIVSGTGVTTAGQTEWQVVAHEIGHNFGAIHDCVSGCNGTTNCCPLTTGSCDSGSKFIMSPTTADGENTFSQCTLGNICSLMQSTTNHTCLQPPDPNKQTIALNMCGNGIVEAGEDCDPGQGTNSTCCDSKTCKFTSGSVCDPASSTCCSAGCQFASAGTVCRPAQDAQCDIAETCTGNSSACPWDRTKANGTPCGSNGLICASGQCTSEAQQCQTIGAAMGLSQACPSHGDSSCQVKCQDPQNSGQCVVLQAKLVDGLPCGYGGTCSGGNCSPGNLLDTAKSWYVSNLQISIPVSVVAGIVALFVLYGFFLCLRSCCCGPRDPPSGEKGFRGMAPQRISSWLGPPPNANGTSGGPMSPATQEPGVWSPPQRERGPVPSALQPGHARGQGSGGSGRRGGSGGSGEGQSRWVDAAQWNGPVQR